MVLVCALAGVAACGKVVDNAPDAAPSCTDGKKNGMESDVDCGGMCDGCADGKFCVAGPDCENGICNTGNCAAPSCSDGVKNGTELDVDCAGSCGAGKCKVGQTCNDNTQCQSQMCAGTNVCIAPKRVFVTTSATGSTVCSGFGVWTNTSAAGTILSDTLSCNNWTANTGGSAWGRLDQTTSGWSSNCSGGTDTCGTQTAPLYCFEQ